MNVTLRLPTVCILALLAAACGKDEPADAQNPLLAYVPAETPYVLANLEPLPEQLVDDWLLRLQPALNHLQADLDNWKSQLQNQDLSGDPAAQLMAAVLAELDGKLDRAGLESLGFSLEPDKVLYGYGMLPIIRIGLGDVQAFRAMLERVQAQSGQQLQAQSLNGQDYWRLAEDNNEPALYAALLDDHLVMGMAPVSMQAQFLPMLLGQQMPARSLAGSGTLEQLARDKAYTPYALGYMDTRLVVGELSNPASVTAPALAGMGRVDTASLGPACAREAGLLASLVPRLIMGNTVLSSDTLAFQYQVETNPLLGAQLAALVSDVPAATSADGSIASLSLALKLGALRTFLLRQSNLLSDFRFDCPQLAGLNQRMMALKEQINQPMPPLLGNFLGLRASLLEWDPTDPQPANIAGLLSLEMDKPQMVIGMASLLIPGFEQLNIEPGADPVRLPQELLSVVTPEFEVYAMMSKDAIGMSLGKGQAAQLPAFMQQKGDNDGVFVSFEYDAGMLSPLTNAGSTQSYTHSPEDPLQQLAQQYQGMLGRSRVELRFTEDGLVIDQRQDFR